ncbi:DUF2208 domain-containing protein [Sulfuracidifex metallicus]|uniref:DUF2208 domain-containing protein n=1 Tax=Sulfuracidifex metallicus TaxID=47303 RepID=UPI002276A11A|nr:DUF2208 domain-containing protein [Sulfuracidifex metallicus]MCY0850535.1 DUF2208 domain-containing protein [Sulfuracidifex metallicus]
MSLGYGNPYSNWRYILLSQFSILFISALLSVFPPQYYIYGYVIYLVVVMSITFFISFRSNPLLKERKYMGEIMKSRTIFEEKDVKEIMEKDEEYIKKYKESLKRNGYFMLYFVVYLAIILVIYDDVLGIYRKMFAANHLELFLVFFVTLDAITLINIFLSRKVMKGATSQTMAPTKYRVTERGIISSDATGVFLHARHLPNSEVIENREKRYVEIKSNTIKLPYDIRLYTKDIDRLLDAIERVKKIEIKRQQSSSSQN